MQVITIVTSLPPAIDGVGDYALHVAMRLRNDCGIDTHFIVGAPAWTGATQMEGFRVTQVSECSAQTLLSVLPNDRFSSDTIVLHYVNYGYAKRGCPIWLIDGLQRWKMLSANRSIVTMFHELYAFGPPWTSSFWLSPLQKNLAGRLARLSDHVLTSTQSYAKLLNTLSGGKHTQIPSLPVFSNMGEPEPVTPLIMRDRRIVVFGSPSNRLRVYRESWAELELTCQQLDIQEIWDIGSSTGLSLSSVNGVPVVELGKRSAAEISTILSHSLAGFFNYPPEYLAKSTIFAAYCAHGLVPVSSVGSAFSSDGIFEGKHFWIPGHSNLLESLQAIADHAHAWYQTHNKSVHTKIFADLLVECQV